MGGIWEVVGRKKGKRSRALQYYRARHKVTFGGRLFFGFGGNCLGRNC